MRDADELINRILLFDGHPNVQRLNPIHVGETPEEMLASGAREREGRGHPVQRLAPRSATSSATTERAAVFEEMVRDEEKHADWFESQLDAIERVGAAQYLAQQIDPGSAP